MRRPVTFLIWLLLVLGAVLLIAWWSPVTPSGAQAITPTVIEPVEPTATPGPLDGLLVRLYWQGLYQDFTCYSAGMAPTPTHDVVETPLPTALPPTPTATQTPLPSATPAPTATPLPTCGGVVIVDTLNARSAPWGTIVTTYEKGTAVGIVGGVWDHQKGTWELWYQATANGQPVLYLYATFVQLNPGAQCDLPAQPPSTAWGVWTGPGASRDELIAFGDKLQAEGITPAATVYGDVATANLLYDRGWIVAWRAYTGLNSPVFDSPPEPNARDWVTRTLAASQGVRYSWLVVCNEPVFPSVAYAVAWIREVVLQADAAGIARVVPVVWSPGRPDLPDVVVLAAALHSDQVQTCWGANLYPAKAGVGLDVVDDWTSYTTYRLLRYAVEVPTCVTEFAAGEGGEVPIWAQYAPFVARYEGRLLWATAWFDALPLSPWASANLRGKLGELAAVLK